MCWKHQSFSSYLIADTIDCDSEKVTLVNMGSNLMKSLSQSVPNG